MTWAAVIGSPIEHSLSPVIHRAAWAQLGIDGWEYHRLEQDTDSLPGFIAGLGADCAGLSVTMPCKQAVMPLLDVIDPLASAVGAVNTVVPSSGVLAGFNTDVTGIASAVRRAWSMAGAPRHRVLSFSVLALPHRPRLQRWASWGLRRRPSPRAVLAVQALLWRQPRGLESLSNRFYGRMPRRWIVRLPARTLSFPRFLPQPPIHSSSACGFGRDRSCWMSCTRRATPHCAVPSKAPVVLLPRGQICSFSRLEHRFS